MNCQGRKDCLNAVIIVVDVDPYDKISGSPLLNSRAYCGKHYAERVLAALEFLQKQLNMDKLW